MRCHNLRPMPGGALRIRGGWKRRVAPSGSVVYRQFHEFRRGTFAGGVFHIVQQYNGAQEGFYSVDLSTWGKSLIELVGPSAYTTNRPLAITTVRDKVFFDNGSGSMGSPPVSSWDGTKTRYVGLDARRNPLGAPTFAGIVALPGNNNITKGMTIWAGLYNSATNHFSNGVECVTSGVPPGETTRLPPTTAQQIEISNLANIGHFSHTGGEAGEQYYVFYATLDGFFTPYLILDADGSDIFKVPIGSASANLSITADDPKGFFVSTAHEMPRENFPPRPWQDACYQNGRVYYIHRAQTPSGAPAIYGEFTYDTPDSDAPSVGWSAAADDYGEAEFVGIPEESYPLTNKKFVPSGEVPLKISDLANRGQVLVITKTHTYWLEELSEGLHVYQRISENRGILDPKTFCKTPRGPMWVTQNYEIVLLHEDNMTLEVLSEQYAELLGQANYPAATFGVAADYLLDSVNMIDRYQVWASNGYFVIHDFSIERDQSRRGVTIAPGYSGQSEVVQVADTVRDVDGKVYHLTAAAAIWTQEGQPEAREILTTDELASGAVVELSGDYISQWLDFGDPLLRKEISEIILTGDAAYSQFLVGSPITVSWFADLYNAEDGVTDNLLSLEKLDQSPTDLAYIGKMDAPHMRWLKYRCQIAGHSSDGPTASYPAAQSAGGELNIDLYGTMSTLAITVNPGGNR